MEGINSGNKMYSLNVFILIRTIWQLKFLLQISGHKNIASINEYRKINNEQHQQISGLLNKTKPVKRAAPVESENRPPNCEVQFQQSEAQAFPLSQSSTAMSYRLGSATTNSTSNISSIFGGKVYGGNFTINVYSPSETKQSRQSQWCRSVMTVSAMDHAC